LENSAFFSFPVILVANNKHAPPKTDSKERICIINMSDDREKASQDLGSHDEGLHVLDLPPDPDAHLTAEERAEVVGFAMQD